MTLGCVLVLHPEITGKAHRRFFYLQEETSMSKPQESINMLKDAMMHSPKISLFQGAGLFVMDTLSSLTLPLIRRKFGERFFSPFWVIVMMVATLAICSIYNVDIKIISIYMGILSLVCFYHFITIVIRNYRDEIWHTRFEGESIFSPLFRFLPKGTHHWWVESVYEPLIVFLLGTLVYLFLDPGLGSIFSLSSVAMLIRSRFRYWLWRQEILDERDLMIESEFKLAAINGQSSEESKGFIVKNAAHMKPSEKRAKARRMFTDEEMQEHFPQAPKDFSHVNASTQLQ